MRILIIGGNSQIGLYLKKTMPQKWDVISTTKNILDITIKDSLIYFCNKFKPNVIINTAAYNLVDNAQNDPISAFAINYQAVQNIAYITNMYNIYLIHFSTAYVFDGKKLTYFEYDKINPINIYGQSKLAGEKTIITNSTNYLIIRTNAIFSEFNSNFVKKILNQNYKFYKIIHDSYLSPTYAANIANLIIFILQKYEFSLNGILHYNGEENISWYDFAKLIFKIAYIKNIINKIPSVEPIKYNDYISKTPRPKYSILSRKEINSIKFRNEVNLIKALNHTIENL